MDRAARYRLLTGSIVPRPIAWIVTQDRAGRTNLAPFSCFNLMGYDPPVVAIGIQRRADGSCKDTYRNIVDTGSLTISLVSASDGRKMTATAAELPADADEAALAGVDLVPFDDGTPPAVANAPVSFGCSLHDRLAMNDAQAIVVARIHSAYCRPDIVCDTTAGYVDTMAMDLIGRMEGPGWYVRCTDRVSHPVPAI